VAGAPLRIVFAGTPEFAAKHLQALLDSEHQLTAVYTQPDRPAGRGKKLQASPVKALASAVGLPVYQPPSLRQAAEQKRLSALGADVMVVVAYGLILPRPVLEAPRLGCINVHASLLPRWRGAAPIQRAIEAGDPESGVTIMQMDAGLDTGAMLAVAHCKLSRHTTAATLEGELARLGPPLLLEVLADLPAHQGRARQQQQASATYAHKIQKAEAALDWRLDCLQLDRRIRAFDPFPVCYTTLDGERVRVWLAAPVGEAATAVAPGTILRAERGRIRVNCGTGQLDLLRLQLPGGRVLSAEQLLNARADTFSPGRVFGLPGTLEPAR
jgi:methionyl-tRNA formyltransferase